MFQVNTMVLIIMVVLVTYRVHAQLTISTSTPTPCYGDVVTLVCHHPELTSNPGRYFSTTPTWREDGVRITPSTGTMFEANTAVVPTHTNLTITITVDHFRNKSFNYSCVLVLADENGLPYEVETSGEVTVDPVEASHPPKITTIESLTERTSLTWTHNAVCFNTSDIEYVVSWVDLASGGGLNGTTVERNFTIRTGVMGVYRVRITATVRGVSSVGGVAASWEDSKTEVLVHPDLTPPHITKMDPLESSITVRWTPQPCAVRYRVSWMYTNDGTTTTGSGVSDQVTNYTIPTSVQGVYTVSVQAVDGVGDVGPATSEVVRSTYPRPTADAPPCEDRSLVLTCLVGGLHNDRRSHFIWMDGNGPLDNSVPYSMTGDQLMIANINVINGEEDKAIRCGEVLSNGIIVEGVEYNVEPLAQPGPPEVTITTTVSTITLTWNTALRCFESGIFTFVVIWNEIGSGTSTNVTTSSSPYTISGLQPGTSYQISVQGVGGSGAVGEIRVLNATTSTNSGGDNLRDNSFPLVVIVPVVVFVAIVLIGAVLAILIGVACWRKTSLENKGVYNVRSGAQKQLTSTYV